MKVFQILLIVLEIYKTKSKQNQMKIKPFLKAIEVAANVVIVGSAAKAIYNKFSSSSDDEDDVWEDETDEDSCDEDPED